MFAAKNKSASGSHTSNTEHQKDSFIQPKLNIGKPGDKYELEADKAADQIVAKGKESSGDFFNPAPLIQQQGDEEVQKQEEDTIQEKPIADSLSPVTQLKQDEDLQKSEEEDVQKQSEEDVQTKGDLFESGGNENIIQQNTEEEIQQKEEEESVQMKDEEAQMKESDIQMKGDLFESGGNENIIQQSKEEEVQQKEEEEIQEKEEEDVQQVQMSGGDDSSSLESNLSNSKGGGSPLPDTTKNEMESGFGADFSGVRVHNDSNAVQMNQELGSQAFANGNDIYFNEGKYNPSSDSGKHLLAHELTHTVQQGASPASNSVQKAEENKPSKTGAPATIIDISNGLDLSQDWLTYLEENPKTKSFDIGVKIGSQFSGTIKIKKSGKPKEGEKQKFELASTKKDNYIDVKGMQFMDPLRGAGVYPVLVLNKFGEEQKTNGFLSIRKEDKVVPDVLGIIKGINENLEAMSFLGLSPIEVAEGLENKFENGGLNFKANNLSANVDGYVEATGSMGITNSAFTFDLSSTVDVAGLASGEFNLSRGEDGKLSGKANIGADIANVNANLTIEYDKGAVTIQGTGKMNSEKFSGEITLLVTDAAKSKQMMNAALGVETMDAEADTAPPATPEQAVTKTKNNQVLAGWGEVQATITPWLEGTAKIGIDSEGHVTIVGEIVVPDEIELMEQRGKKVDIFSVEIRAGYGIPLVGQVFLFASIGMFVNAGFGPLVLKDVGFTGTYSTDPSVLQEFSITGTLGINAFAILGLEAEAGVGLTLLGHDVKAGVNVTAAAGLRAYAEATPTFQYKESASPEGGKVGESRLKGHFEAAAQLFLQLSGALFYELDSPWWSPAPDGREEYPLGEVQYPIGDSMGIGADMDWLVGSEEAPELAFSPVEFDPDKFTADVMADPPPKKRGKSDQNPQGEWKGEPGGEQEKDPKVTGDGKGLPENGKKKEDLKKLPDEQKYMRALDEMSKLEKLDPKATYEMVNSKAAKVKSKYGLDKIQLKNKKDDSVDIFVKHKKQDNGKHMVTIPLMSAAERAKLITTAKQDLSAKSKKAAGEGGTIKKEDAETLLANWKKAHPVIEEASIKDGETTWDYTINGGDKDEIVGGNKKEVEKDADAEKLKKENKNVNDVKITPEDVKQHQKIAKEIKKKLDGPTQDGETFEKFYDRKKGEALVLENAYQPKLKKGINIDITVGTLSEEKKDNDLDFKIRIYPNDTEETVQVDYDEGQEITNESLVAELEKLPASANNDTVNSKVGALRTIVASESLNYVFTKIKLKDQADKSHFIIEITEVIKTTNADDKRKKDVSTTNIGTVKIKRKTESPDSKGGAPDINQFLVQAETRFSDGSKAAVIADARKIHQELRVVEKESKIADLQAYMKKLDNLSGLLAQLSDVEDELPNTTYEFNQDSDGLAVKAEAKNLTTKTGPGTAPEGNIKGWNFVTGSLNDADTKLWVRLHLINEKKFGGRGGSANLVPGTKNNNSDHLANFENKLKKWLDTKVGDQYPVGGMEADVSRYAKGQFVDDKHHHINAAIDGEVPKSEWYADQIVFTAKEYVGNNGAWTKGSEDAVPPLRINIPLPNFNAIAIPTLPTIYSEQLKLIANEHSSNPEVFEQDNVKHFLRREVFTGLADFDAKVSSEGSKYGLEADIINDLPDLIRELIDPNRLTF